MGCGSVGNDRDLPSCREFADAAANLGFRVERIPKNWWQRQHYRISEPHLILTSFRGILEGPHCVGCECVCALCDDCSDCDCSCENCYCANRCQTRSCIVVCGLESGAYAVRKAHAQSDDQVGMDATILRTRRWSVSKQDGVSKYRLKRVTRGWHLDGCAHTNRSYSADELVNLTFKPYNDGDAALDRDARYDLILPEYDCCALRGFYVDRYFASWPSCLELAAAARRAGYTIAPAGRRSDRLVLEFARTPRAHFDFLDADFIHLESSSGAAELLADERRCNSECDCDCRDTCASCDCTCRGCYCEKTCLYPHDADDVPTNRTENETTRSVDLGGTDAGLAPSQSQDAGLNQPRERGTPQEPLQQRSQVSVSRVFDTIWKVFAVLGFIFLLVVMLTGECRGVSPAMGCYGAECDVIGPPHEIQLVQDRDEARVCWRRSCHTVGPKGSHRDSMRVHCILQC